MSGPMVVRMGAVAVALGLAWSSASDAAPVVFSASGPNATDITTAVTNFRNALGALNPNDPVSFSGGRREINWDAVPDSFADPNPFPGNFFNANFSPRARGVEFTTPGTGFLVSADSSNPTSTPTGFGFTDLRPFSAERLFAPVGSTITDVFFFLPGTNASATVSAFGVVFSDVEVAGSTGMQFFDAAGNSLFSQSVLTSVSGGFSFLGVRFDAGERIGRVRITSGSAPLLANGVFGSGSDGVVMDDFIYAEPVPEPSSVLLLVLGSTALAACSRARQES